jgi:signal transduction histidine kinase
MKVEKMKKVSAVLAILVLVTVPLVASADDTTATQLVDNALNIWKDKGKDYALKVINASAGPLKKGPMYTFACDLSGTILAHPTQTKLRGQNMLSQKDAKGTLIFQELIKAAKTQDGSGWVEYQWLSPDGAGPTTKRTLVKKVPGEDVLVACGYHVN